jgi:hypothetical protein
MFQQRRDLGDALGDLIHPIDSENQREEDAGADQVVHSVLKFVKHVSDDVFEHEHGDGPF